MAKVLKITWTFLLTNSTALAQTIPMENNEREALLAQVRRRYEILAPYLTEQTKRVWAAAEALTIGRGPKMQALPLWNRESAHEGLADQLVGETVQRIATR